jgi:hypothetical protein
MKPDPKPESHMPSQEDIARAREYVLANKSKLRPGSKMTINMKTMDTRHWPTIECWVHAKRQYLPLCVGEVWRYETAEQRDAVLAALQKA